MNMTRHVCSVKILLIFSFFLHVSDISEYIQETIDQVINELFPYSYL